jgi:hypothetical protein
MYTLFVITMWICFRPCWVSWSLFLWIFLKGKLLSEILELCVLHLNSTNSRVRAKFSHLLSLVPWYFTISRLTEADHAAKVKVSMRMFRTRLNLMNSKCQDSAELYWHYFVLDWLVLCCIMSGDLILDVSLSSCIQNKPLEELSGFTLDSLCAAQRHHISRGSCGEMQPQHFRKFMGYLLQGVHYRWVNWTRSQHSAIFVATPLRTSDHMLL